MSMSLSNIYSDDMELEILTREFVLDIETIQHELIHANNLYEEQSFFEDTEVEEKTDSIIKKIIKAIKNMISTILDYIREFFKSINLKENEKLSVKDYINSDAVSLRINGDIEYLQQQSEREIAEGHALVKAIAKGTGADPVAVKKFTDKVQSFVMKQGATILTATAAVALGNKINESLHKNKDILSEIDEYTDLIEKEDQRRVRLKTNKLKESGKIKLAMMKDMTYNFSLLTKRLTAPAKKIAKELEKVRKSL